MMKNYLLSICLISSLFVQSIGLLHKLCIKIIRKGSKLHLIPSVMLSLALTSMFGLFNKTLIMSIDSFSTAKCNGVFMLNQDYWEFHEIINKTSLKYVNLEFFKNNRCKTVFNNKFQIVLIYLTLNYIEIFDFKLN